MFKRLLNKCTTRSLADMASKDAVPQTSGKRHCLSEDKPAKKWKKADVQPMLEGNINRKRKVAILVAYNGKGYYGLQINPGFKTVESDLCKALVAVGLVPQEHADEMQKMAFQRAARTDKGVSAAANVVSLKMLLNVDDIEGRLNKELPAQIRVMAWMRTTQSFNCKNYCDARTYIYMMPTYAFAPVDEIVTDAYRTTPEIIDYVNDILKKFLGTHNFFNFTSRVKADAANAKRFIMSFECGKPFVRDGVEFVVVSVKGQSFMLHQIRKMIGLTIAVARGYCGTDAIELAWQPEKVPNLYTGKCDPLETSYACFIIIHMFAPFLCHAAALVHMVQVDIPIAPSTGLMLDQLHYNGYNKRYGNDGIHEPLDWSSVQEKVDKFKEEHIFTDIIQAEVKERSMISWLSTLHIHTFSTEHNYTGNLLDCIREAKKTKTNAAGKKSTDAAADAGASDKLTNEVEVDKDSNSLTNPSADDKDSNKLTNQSEDSDSNKLTDQSEDKKAVTLTNQIEDDKDSEMLTTEIVDKTAKLIPKDIALEFKSNGQLVPNEQSTQNSSSDHMDPNSKDDLKDLDIDAETSQEPAADGNDMSAPADLIAEDSPSKDERTEDNS